ncbi:PKD domain-containing protein [Parafrankia elaeagni]|uniref:PKD domain-containing protein n=1 Tax=Parafrankia elaeagni TaxID=222534 RepID=UPI00054F2F20|nr:PKD domain-containing protein [Parafrankia elaeagni]
MAGTAPTGRPRRRAGARRLEIGVAVALLLSGLIVAGTATGPRQRAVSFSDGKAWLVSDAVGQVALVDGVSEKIVTQVTVGAPNLPPGTLAATQSELDAYVTDSAAGVVGRVSGATYAWTGREGVAEPGDPDQLFAGAHALYLVSGRSGIVTTLDPQTMRVRGRQSLAARIGPDSGVVDERGWLWVIDGITGDLVWFDGTTRREHRAAVDPEHTRLVLVDGRPTLVDLGGRRVAPITADGAIGTSTCLDVAPGDTTARVAGDPQEPRVLAAIGSRGVLMIADLDSGRCQSVVDLHAASHDLGAPLTAAGRALVPDYTSGQVHIVDLTTAELLAAPEVLPERRRFTLASQGGFVFFNDPSSDEAGLIRPDGSTAAVRKYLAADAADAADARGTGGTGGTAGAGAGGGTGTGTGSGAGAGGEPPTTPPAGPSTERTPPVASPGPDPGDTTPPPGPDPAPRRPPGQPGTPPPSGPGVPGGPGDQTDDQTGDQRNLLQIAASETAPSVGEAVVLRATMADNTGVDSVTWSFGDGDGATLAGGRANHAWAAPGSFVVTADASLADGRSVTAVATIPVSRDDPEPGEPGQDPVPRLTVDPRSGGSPLTVTADGSASTADGGPIASHSIDFGDGMTQPGPGATHTYTRPGIFTVTLTVTDAAGRRAAVTERVQVNEVAPTGPDAQLGVSAAGTSAPTEIVADASASTAGSTPIATYRFTFSTGQTVGPQASSTARIAVSAGGTYAVTVTVSDGEGRESTANGSVTVPSAMVGPRAALALITPPAGGQGGTYSRALDASASAPGSSPIVSYTFDFDDGHVEGPQPDPVSGYYMYGEGGDFVGTVTVIDQNGLRDTASVDMLVRARDAEMSLSKTLVSTSVAGTRYEVTIRGGVDPIVISSISGPVDGGCSGTRLIPDHTCTFGATLPAGSTSAVVTVTSDATNSPQSIDLGQ